MRPFRRHTVRGLGSLAPFCSRCMILRSISAGPGTTGPATCSDGWTPRSGRAHLPRPGAIAEPRRPPAPRGPRPPTPVPCHGFPGQRCFADELGRYLGSDRWFQNRGRSPLRAVAYFSPEFGRYRRGATAVLMRARSPRRRPSEGIKQSGRPPHRHRSHVPDVATSASTWIPTAGRRSAIRSWTPTAWRCASWRTPPSRWTWGERRSPPRFGWPRSVRVNLLPPRRRRRGQQRRRAAVRDRPLSYGGETEHRIRARRSSSASAGSGPWPRSGVETQVFHRAM